MMKHSDIEGPGIEVEVVHVTLAHTAMAKSELIKSAASEVEHRSRQVDADAAFDRIGEDLEHPPGSRPDVEQVADLCASHRSQKRTLDLGPGSQELRFYENLALGSDHLAAVVELKTDGLRDSLPLDNEAFVLVPKFQKVKVLAVSPGNLFLDDADLVRVYDAVHEAGRDLGLRDLGSYALNSMRIEKGYHGWGSEFGVEYSPFDVGLDRFLDLDKPDFIGRAATRDRADRPAAWSYGVWTVDVTDMPGPAGDPPPSAPIRIDGVVAGFVTSASMGFRTGRRVCLGYVEGRFADVTDGFTIDGYGHACPAERHPHGIYDPDHSRPRG